MRLVSALIAKVILVEELFEEVLKGRLRYSAKQDDVRRRFGTVVALTGINRLLLEESHEFTGLVRQDGEENGQNEHDNDVTDIISHVGSITYKRYSVAHKEDPIEENHRLVCIMQIFKVVAQTIIVHILEELKETSHSPDENQQVHTDV